MGSLRNGTLFRLLGAGLLLLLSGMNFAWAMKRPQDYSGWYPAFSQKASRVLSRVFSPGLFSWGEIFLYLGACALVGYIIYTIVLGVREERLTAQLLRCFSALLFLASALLFAFLGLWGLNYFAPSLADTMGLEVRQRPVAALVATALEVREELVLLAEQVPRGDDGVCNLGGFQRVRVLVSGDEPAPKRIFNGKLMSQLGLSGVYSPWTGEANVNPDTPEATLPFTMAHEMAHRAGIAPEDEANFAAFLTCRDSGVAELRYSGYFCAFIHLSNALATADADAQYELWYGLSPAVLADLKAVRDHYAQYEGPVQKAGESVNDAYLRAMKQDDGVASYGRVADLLIAEYVSRHGEIGAV